MLSKKEKSKVDYEHKLQLRRIIIEKLLLGLVIAMVAFFGQRLLKDYESDLTKNRFLLSQRLEGLNQIRSTYSNLSIFAREVAAKNGEMPAQLRTKYKKGIDEFVANGNRWAVLFSDKFTESLEHHVMFHQAIAYEHAEFDLSHWDFAKTVFASFDNLTRNALHTQALGEPQSENQSVFQFDLLEQGKTNAGDLNTFFRKNFGKWKNLSK